MRVSQPYEAVTSEPSSTESPVVGTAPTMASRCVHGNDYWRGISVRGTKAQAVPIQHPYAGQGLVSPAFPLYQPSSVADDEIRPPFLLTTNNYSPVSHASARYDFSLKPVTRAVPASTKLPGVNNTSRRGDGAGFTTPFPLATQQWPTSSEWLGARMRQSQGE